MDTATATLVVQTVGVTFTALAALAASVSARASSRTAARADDTARRAAEALGHSMAPSIRAERLVEPPNLPPVDGRPQFALLTMNVGAHPGRITGVRIERTDGRPDLVRDELDVAVGPELDALRGVTLGAMERHRPDPAGTPSATRDSFGTIAVRYTDAQELVTWEQEWELTEGVGWEGTEPGQLPADPSSAVAYWSYDTGPPTSVPRAVAGTTDPPPTPGWGRRGLRKLATPARAFWRSFWGG